MIKNENITLYYDDALNVLPTIETKSINHCLTSPPYNRKRNDKYKEFTDINKNYLNFNISIINEMLRICNKYVFYNIQTNYYFNNYLAGEDDSCEISSQDNSYYWICW